MFFFSFEEQLGAARRFHSLAQLCNQPFVLVIARTACTTIGYAPFGIDRCEVQTCCQVTFTQIETYAKCAQHTAADIPFERIITKQREMSGTAAGCNAGSDGLVEPER